MATREELDDTLSWDVDRLSVAPGETVSDDALAVLDSMGDAKCVAAVREYIDADGDERVATTHLLRVLQRADGRLALETWTNGGYQTLGYLPDDQRFDVGRFVKRDERMGKDPESYERLKRADAKDLLAWGRPAIVMRTETELLPAVGEQRVVP